MKCAFCGCEKTEATRWNNIFGSGANLVRCVECGLKFYDKQTFCAERFYDAPNYDAYINRHIDNGTPFLDNPEQKTRYELVRNSVYNRLLAKLREYCGQLDSLFEIGASWGLFLQVAKERGVRQLGGCDLSGEACRKAKERGYSVQHAPFMKASVPENLDAIVSLDVIEHSETPGEDMRKTFDHLRSGGVFLVKTFYDEWHDTADIDLSKPLKRDVVNYLKTGYFGVSHLYHFDTDVLMRCLTRCGFAVRDVAHSESCGQVEIFAEKP